MASEPFQMAMIHRTFRIEFGNIPALINDVAPGDVKRSRTVGAYLGNMMSVLHHHHAAEDDFLWPTLHTRSGHGDDVADRARAEHLAIADVMKDIESIRPSWQRTADSRRGNALADRVDALSGSPPATSGTRSVISSPSSASTSPPLSGRPSSTGARPTSSRPTSGSPSRTGAFC